MPVTGGQIVAKNIIAFGGGFLKAVDKEMRVIEKGLRRKVSDNISRRDFSLQELAAKDHPFAKRHGPTGKPVYDPYWMVHKRSGKLLSSMKSGIEPASTSGGTFTAAAFVRLDDSVAKHANYVVFGTSKMIPRPVLEGSRDQVAPELIRHLQSKLRDFTFSFRR